MRSLWCKLGRYNFITHCMPPEQFRCLELFPGEANVFEMVRKVYAGVAADLTYLDDPASDGNNPSNLNSPAGLAKLVFKYVCRLPMCMLVPHFATVLPYSKDSGVADPGRT